MNIVTGAFGYIGKYITQRLLKEGEEVRTITTHPDKPSIFGDLVKPYYYDFNNPDLLVDHLHGADTLFNTYWIRFPYDGQTFESAIHNTEILFSCAKSAGIKKIVQISVTNASEHSMLPYYRGKAVQEKLLKNCGIDYSIIRPTLVFGTEDILVNNICWLIRHFPFFPIFGDGGYRVQPVNVEDLARIAIEGANLPRGTLIDATGPESFPFVRFISLITQTLNSRCIPLKISPKLGINIGKIIGLLVSDVLLTENELRGLMDNLLTSEKQPNGIIKFSQWLVENKEIVGMKYTSEIKRHFRWSKS